MFRFFGRWLTVLALCGALGLHWAALQSTAWTLMLIENAKKESLAQALAKTFDGAHPCSLCRGIEKGRMAEKALDLATTDGNSKPKPASLSKLLKPDLICGTRLLCVRSGFQNLSYEMRSVQFLERTEAPLVPPPRGLLS